MRRAVAMAFVARAAALGARGLAPRSLAPRSRRVLPRAATTTPDREVAHEYEVKKSIFLVTLARADTGADARAFVASRRDPKANHNCWACVTGDATVADDDGEPSGTAGRPILAALEKNDVVDAVLLVQRYKKGPKLGAGGLIRAYGASARECVAAAADAGALLENREVAARLTVRARADRVGELYRTLATVERRGERHDGTFVEIDVIVYADDVAAARNTIVYGSRRGRGRDVDISRRRSGRGRGSRGPTSPRPGAASLPRRGADA